MRRAKIVLIVIGIIILGGAIFKGGQMIYRIVIEKLMREKLRRTMANLNKTVISGLTLAEKVKIWAEKLGIPDTLAYALIGQESEGDTKAIRVEKTKTGEVWDVSYGLTQILCKTTAIDIAKRYGETITSCEVLYDVDKNLKYGLTYLKDRIDQWTVVPRNEKFWKSYTLIQYNPNETDDQRMSKLWSEIKRLYKKHFGTMLGKYNAIDDLNRWEKDKTKSSLYLALVCYNGGGAAFKNIMKENEKALPALQYGIYVLRYMEDFEQAKVAEK